MEDDDYDMFGKLRPFSSKGGGGAAGRIPWFRGQTFSFSTVSCDVDNEHDDGMDGLESMSSYHYPPSSTGPRSSLLRSSLGTASKQLFSSSGVPIATADPQAVYRFRSAHHETNNSGTVEVNSIALSANGSVSLIGYSDGRVGIVHTADGARGDFTQHSAGKAVRQVSISVDGKVGASACLDGTVRIFETDTLIQVALLRQTGFAWANGVALSADGRVVIASFTPRDSDRGKVVRYDWAERRVIALWTGFSKVFEVAVDKNAEKIAFIRQSGTIAVLTAPVSNTDTNNTTNKKPAITAQYKYMKGDLDMAMDAQGNSIMIIDRTLRFHRVRSSCSDLLPEYKPHKVRKIALTADGSRSAEVRKNNVIIRSLGTHDCGKITLALRHKHKISQVNIAADGTTILAADIYSNLVLWRPDTLPKTNTILVEKNENSKITSSDIRDIRSCLSDANFNLSPIARYLPSPSPAPTSPVSPPAAPASPKPIIPPPYEYKEQPPLDLKLDMTPQRPIARFDTLPLEVVSMKGGISVAPSPTPAPLAPSRRRRSSVASPPAAKPPMYPPPAYPPPPQTHSTQTITHVESAVPVLPTDPNAMNAAFFALTDAFTSVETAVPYDYSIPPTQSEPQAAINDVADNLNDNLFVSVESVQLPHEGENVPDMSIFTSVESVSISPPPHLTEQEPSSTTVEEILPAFDIQRVESEVVTGHIRDNDGAELRGIMFDSLPSQQKLSVEEGFPALAPSFPVLEPEMSAASNVLRDARK